MSQKQAVLFINMAKGFGGGEFYTEQLMKNVQGFDCYFFGKSSGKLVKHLRQNMPQIRVINFWQMLKLAFSHKNLIIHALDGRAVHIGALLKKLFHIPFVITRQVSFSLKRQSSQKSYALADRLVGVSKHISENLQVFNPNVSTVYGCLKPLEENAEFEQRWFTNKPNGLKIAQIGNFQAVKNFPLTIELAKRNPNISFYLVGSGELETELKNQAQKLNNVVFIPFTPYVGSVLKQVDLLIMPSHSEGLGMAILEAYQYHVPVLAHAIGGMPEIVEHNRTGFLISPNQSEQYQVILERLLAEPPTYFAELRQNISAYLTEKDFSAQRMAREYEVIYQQVLAKISN